MPVLVWYKDNTDLLNRPVLSYVYINKTVQILHAVPKACL